MDFHWKWFYIYWVAACEKAAEETGTAAVAALSAAADPKERAEDAFAKKAAEDAKAKQQKVAFKTAVGKSPAAGQVAADEVTNEAEADSAQWIL